MSVPSPLLLAGSVVSFAIKADGKVIDSTLQVISIDTWNDANRIPHARLEIYDGDAADQNFPASNLRTFLPGAKLEIGAGYDEKTIVVFSGVIVRQGLSIQQTGGSRLVVEAMDAAVKMTLERNNAVFPKATDSDVISKLIAASGLKKDVKATTAKYEDIVQYYCTDWDLMLTRAELNGFVVTVQAGTVMVKPPDTAQAPVLLVEYGSSLLDLDTEMDAMRQYASASIKSSSWDEGTQQVLCAGPESVNVKEQGNVSSAELAKVFGVKTFALQTGAMLEKPALQAWSSAELLRSKMSKIRGTVRFQGSALAVTGKTIQLGGLGDRFNGNAWISGVHHRIADGLWLTTATLGMAWPWFTTEAAHIVAPGASGQLPPIQGLQTGKVKQVAKDETGQFRVQVVLPILGPSAPAVWARLSTLYASNKVGTVFFPEVDDEVIVGFMNDDPRYPVILGSVYSKKLPPAYPPDSANNTKAIVTRSKLEILFNDKDTILQINTPKKQTVTLDDKAGSITIKDSNKNIITLSKSGITLDSASNLTIKAKGNITVDAGGNLKMSAKANASMEALQVAHTAKMKFSAQGKAAAELKSSGMLTVQGTLVKIN